MKKNTYNRFTALLISTFMMLQLLQGMVVPVRAEDTENGTETVEEVIPVDEPVETTQEPEVVEVPVETEEPQPVTEEPTEPEQVAESAPVETVQPTEEIPVETETMTLDTIEPQVIDEEALSASLITDQVSVMSLEETTEEVDHDLGKHIRSLEIVGNPESVNANDPITVKLSWLIEGKVAGGIDEFTYQLPLNFNIEAAATGPITKGVNGERIGTYLVNTDGLLTIQYDETYNTNKQTTLNMIEITGKAKYREASQDNQIKFTWNDHTTIIVIVNPGDFTVKKKAVKTYRNNVLSDDATIAYTVTIKSDLGTLESFTITDTLKTSRFGTNDTAVYDPSSFSLVNTTTGTTVPITPVINGKSFTLNNIPALNANESYTLKYNVNTHVENKNANTETTLKITSMSNPVISLIQIMKLSSSKMF